MEPDSVLDRFSFRDDALVQDIGALLARGTGHVNILDCGCGDGRLARALMVAQLATSRISYSGVDRDNASVLGARAAKLQGAFAAFRSFKISLRETADLAGYEAGSYHIVVLTNLLHEIWPESIPELLSKVNKLLVHPGGTVCIVDMEQLPPETNEPWAVTWSSDELERLLTSGGFTVSVSKHPKRVPVYRISVKSRKDVNVGPLTRTLSDLLIIKKERLINELLIYRDSGNISTDSIRTACQLAAVETSLRRIEMRSLYA